MAYDGGDHVLESMEGTAVTDNNRQPNGALPEEFSSENAPAAEPKSADNTLTHRDQFASPEALAVSPITGADKAKGTVKRFFVWLWLTAKRFLKKPSFVLIFLMLPAVLLLYRALITADDGKLHVAVYFEEKDEFAETYLRELSENVPELFVFYECAEEEDLYSDVAAGRAECGYTFAADLAGKLLTEDWQGMITAVVSDQTAYGEFVNEIAYIKLIRILGKDLMKEYLVKKSGVVNADNIDNIDAMLTIIYEERGLTLRHDRGEERRARDRGEEARRHQRPQETDPRYHSDLRAADGSRGACVLVPGRRRRALPRHGA